MVLFVFSCQFLLYHLAFCWASSWFTLLKTPYMPPVHLTQFPIVFTCDLLHCVFFFLSCVGVSILTSRTWGLQSKKLTNSKLMHPWRKAFFFSPPIHFLFLIGQVNKNHNPAILPFIEWLFLNSFCPSVFYLFFSFSFCFPNHWPFVPWVSGTCPV